MQSYKSCKVVTLAEVALRTFAISHSLLLLSGESTESLAGRRDRSSSMLGKGSNGLFDDETY